MKPGDSATAPPDAKDYRGVLVATLASGKPVREYGDSPGDFMARLGESSLAWVNFAVDDLRRDGAQVAAVLGFGAALVENLLEKSVGSYEDRESEFGLRVPVVKIHGGELEREPLLILVRWGLILSLHQRGKVNRMVKLSRYADVFMRKIPHERPMADKITILLTRLLDENNERNFEVLRFIQDEGDQIGAVLLDQKRARELMGKQVFQVKHLLLQYLNSLWSCLDVVQSIRWGDAELITDDETLLARVGILADDITRQIELSEHTTEVLVSGLEVLSSIYNAQLQQLNNRLAVVVTWLTILGTLILVPNTIATLVGPITSYHGPELIFYAVGVSAATAIATWLSWSYIKRSGVLDVRSGDVA